MVIRVCADRRPHLPGSANGTSPARISVLILLFLASLLFLLLPGSVIAFEAAYAHRIYPGVRVWDVDIGGLSVEEAAAALESGLRFDRPLMTVRDVGKEWAVRPADLGVHVDTEATLRAAYQLGREGTWVDRGIAQIRLLLFGVTLPPVLVYDQRVTRLFLETLAQQLETAPVDASLALNGTTPVIVPARSGRQLNVEASLARLRHAIMRFEPAEVELVWREIPPAVRDADVARREIEALLAGPLTLVLANPNEGDPGPWVLEPQELGSMVGLQVVDGVLHASLSAEALQNYLLTYVAPAVAVEPVDARFHFNDVTRRLEPIRPSRNGRALDVEASVTRILEELAAGNRFVPLVLATVPPRYPDTATAQELGIVELVAEGDSYFIGSPSGRDHNIRLAASKFDGLIIPPGETFSFNQYLGEVSAEAGYDEAYVTMGERLAIEVGGGICQVSTTAFRAAFWGGYPIVERWAHNHRIGYYELMGADVGMDATVYSPYVDFRFVNDRDYPLLIETEIDDAAHRLVFRFYSTSDGRRVEKIGPIKSEPVKPGPPIYQLDERMAPGTVKQWQTAVDGLTATIERRVYDAAGNLLFRDTFVSRYAPRRAIYHYGPGYEPPAVTGEEQPS